MARISAYGDTEHARWRRTRESPRSTPFEMTLTHMGRVLYKNERTGKWSAQRGRGSKVPGPVKIDQAAAQAAMFRMERVK